MSDIVSREQVEQILQAMVGDKVDGIRAVILLDHDAALRQQLAEATKIIQGFTELGPIMQADIDWAKTSLTQMDLFKRDMAAKDAEIAILKQDLNAYRTNGVTEELLRRHDGSIKLARECSIIRTDEWDQKDAEIAALKREVSQLLFFTPGGG